MNKWVYEALHAVDDYLESAEDERPEKLENARLKIKIALGAISQFRTNN